MKTWVIEFAEKYGPFVISGLVGAVVHRLRNSMTLKKFLSALVVSGFVGLCVGILTKNYFNATDEVTFVICSVAGVFSKELLDEIQEIISQFSEWFKKWLGLKKSANADSSDSTVSKEDTDNLEK